MGAYQVVVEIYCLIFMTMAESRLAQHLVTMLIGFGLGCAMIYAAGGQPLGVILPASDMAAELAPTRRAFGAFPRSTAVRQRGPAPVYSTNPDAPIKLGINGFGRIGRQVARIAMDREDFVLK